MRRLTMLLLACTVAWAAAAPRAPLEPRKTVAVLSFDNDTRNADYDPLGHGMASMMVSDLASVKEIQLVERDRLKDLEGEMDRQHTKYFDSTTAVRMGRIVGAQYIVAGAIVTIKPAMVVNARVIRVETSEIVKAAQVTGKEDAFFDLEQRLAHQLIDGLDIALDPEAQRQLAARQEANRVDHVSTMLSYSQALALFDAKDYVGAATKMQPVLQSSPNAPVMRDLSEAIGKHLADRALDEAKKKANKLLNGLFKPPGR